MRLGRPSRVTAPSLGRGHAFTVLSTTRVGNLVATHKQLATVQVNEDVATGKQVPRLQAAPQRNRRRSSTVIAGGTSITSE